MWVLMSQKHSNLKRHYDEEEAMAEAKRLCVKEGVPVEVYKCVGQMQTKEQPVEFITHREPIV